MSFFTVLLSKFLLYSEVCLMSCNLLALFLCINYMYIFVLKYTVIPVVRNAITYTMSFLEMELTDRKPKFITVYLYREPFYAYY